MVLKNITKFNCGPDSSHQSAHIIGKARSTERLLSLLQKGTLLVRVEMEEVKHGDRQTGQRRTTINRFNTGWMAIPALKIALDSCGFLTSEMMLHIQDTLTDLYYMNRRKEDDRRTS